MDAEIPIGITLIGAAYCYMKAAHIILEPLQKNRAFKRLRKEILVKNDKRYTLKELYAQKSRAKDLSDKISEAKAEQNYEGLSAFIALHAQRGYTATLTFQDMEKIFEQQLQETLFAIKYGATKNYQEINMLAPHLSQKNSVRAKRLYHALEEILQPVLDAERKEDKKVTYNGTIAQKPAYYRDVTLLLRKVA